MIPRKGTEIIFFIFILLLFILIDFLNDSPKGDGNLQGIDNLILGPYNLFSK